MPSDEKLNYLYKQNYSTENIGSDETQQTSPNNFNKILAKFIYKKLISNYSKKNYLDFGSGMGDLIIELSLLDSQNLNNFEGVEFNNEARNYSNKKFEKKQIFKLLPKKKYEIISMIEVIEHLKNPWQDLKKIYKSLNKDGKLIITTPNLNGLKSKLMKDNWSELIRPTHLVLFEQKTLRALLLNAGFNKIEFQKFYPLAHSSLTNLLKTKLFQLCGWHGGICVIATK